MSAVVFGSLAGFALVLVVTAGTQVRQQLHRATVRARLQTQVRVRFAPPKWIRRRAVWISSVVLVVALTTNPLLALATALFGLVGHAAYGSWQRQRSAMAYETELPVVLEELSRSLRSGASVITGLGDIKGNSALRSDVAAVSSALRHGRSLEEALAGWTARAPSSSVRLVATALTVSTETGGAQARTIDGVATTLRQRLDAQSTASVAATESQASAAALTLMPIFISGPLLMINSAARTFVLHTPIGTSLLLVGLALDGLGAWVMARMIRSATT